MRKDKRGMALITAIAVLALMLILFGGLAMIYSSQVSRNKLEHEQSQAMLLAQSYTEMLNHVLESSHETDADFRKALGNIDSREVEIETKLNNSERDDDITITAKGDRWKTNGNTRTRTIEIKVTATVDNETRSIISNYTYQEVTGGGVPDYAVYGNKINYFKNGDMDKPDPILFNDNWYLNKNKSELINDLALLSDGTTTTYKVGGTDNGPAINVFNIKKDPVIAPNQSDPPIAADYENFAKAINNNGEDITIMPAWSLRLPDDTTPLCSNIISNHQITKNCIWNEDMKDKGDVTFYAGNEDIIVYLPIEGELTIESPSIYFAKEVLGEADDKHVRQLYFYAYPVNSNRPAKLTIDGRVTIANSEIEGMSKCLDIFFICNDEIKLYLPELKTTNGNEYKQLEAYFYFPKGTVEWDAVPDLSTGNVYKNRIRGCLIADEIKILENKNDSHKGFVGIDYIPPRELDSGASNEKTISFKLNSYEEGGKS